MEVTDARLEEEFEHECNCCDFCGKEFKTDRGLRTHFGMIHSKAQCDEDKHQFDEYGVCTVKNCLYRREWVGDGQYCNHHSDDPAHDSSCYDGRLYQ